MRKSELTEKSVNPPSALLVGDAERRVWQIYARIVGGRICADLSERSLCKAAFAAARRAVDEYQRLIAEANDEGIRK